MKSFTRSGLDHFLFENFFRGKRQGVFVDAGGHDTERFNNSLFFERFLDWSGLCVEPGPQSCARLTAQRKCKCEQAPVSKLAALLEKYSLTRVDYCSIDAQGAELAAVSELDPGRFNISLFSIRNAAGDERIGRLMQERGYDQIVQLDQDCVFKHRDVKRLARTSVICAVWHRDADRHRLLEGHAQNLSRQTVPVEPIYIFDGRDEPPAALPGRKVVAHEGLSIYQAWNVGLAMVSTPFVMNLNLDDRLAPDAIELLENTLLSQNAALVGGDWKICYSQEETDAVQAVFPAERLPAIAKWPPPQGTRARLGSGTGERGTLGPATLWRVDTHIGAPRYPWRFMDGTVVKVIGDVCWWNLVTEHLKKKAVRIADVIGNYYSHPGAQAEFRGGPESESALAAELGVSLV
jgi:hypothetical protein